MDLNPHKNLNLPKTHPTISMTITTNLVTHKEHVATMRKGTTARAHKSLIFYSMVVTLSTIKIYVFSRTEIK